MTKGEHMTIEAMKLVVAKLEYVLDCINKEKMPFDGDAFHEALRFGRQAIEQAQQAEPVAFINVEKRTLEWANYTRWDTPTIVNLPKIPLYTSPPQRQPLTDEECDAIYNELDEWVRNIDSYGFGLPLISGGGIAAGREVIRQAIKSAHGIKRKA